MDKFKIEHFQRDNPGIPFPLCESLKPETCSFYKERFAELIGLQPAIDPLVLVKKLNEMAVDVARFDPDSVRLDLSAILQSLKINPPQQVYLNWYRFDDIDTMALADLQLHLGNIWYSGSEDIDIFDDTLKWILSLTHYGVIRAVKF